MPRIFEPMETQVFIIYILAIQYLCVGCGYLVNRMLKGWFNVSSLTWATMLIPLFGLGYGFYKFIIWGIRK